MFGKTAERKKIWIMFIFTTPKGKIYNQALANKFSLAENIIIIAGHYKGIDDRVREKFATDEISIGNFIISGGELLTLIITDSIVRILWSNRRQQIDAESFFYGW